MNDKSNRRKDTRADAQRRGNSRSGSRRSQDSAATEKRPEVDTAGFPRHNDPSWYSAYPQLLKDSASLSFANPLGQPLDAPTGEGWYDGDTALTWAQIAVPGIMRIRSIPTPGLGVNYTSPINVLAQTMYSYVCHANSRSGKYDANDLAEYVFAAANAYVAWATLTRLYGTLTSYSRTNRYYARYMVEAMGFNFQDLHANMADLRAYINKFALRLGSLCVPKDFTFIKRYMYLYGNIFQDSESGKAQTYIHVPERLWVYEEMGSERGGVLVPVVWGQETTFENIVAICDDMISKLMLAQSADTMGADIYKAYGKENLMTVCTIPEDYRVYPMYDPRMGAEIRNLVAVGEFRDGWDSNNILADVTTEGISFDPCFQVFNMKKVPELKYLFLNWDGDTVGPDDVMKATRMMVLPVVDHNAGDESYCHLLSCGTEVVTYFDVFTVVSMEGTTELKCDTFASFGNTNSPSGYQTFDLCLLSKFRWHPYLYTFFESGDDPAIMEGVFGEIDNFTLISEHEIAKLHETALFSLYYNPNMGTFLRG